MAGAGDEGVGGGGARDGWLRHCRAELRLQTRISLVGMEMEISMAGDSICGR